jgi:hypothetical protein
MLCDESIFDLVASCAKERRPECWQPYHVWTHRMVLMLWATNGTEAENLAAMDQQE